MTDLPDDTKPHDEAFTEAQTGAESTYVHGGQRPMVNPPGGTGEDVSPHVADDLNEMHVDSKLAAQDATSLPQPTDDGLTDEQRAERADALKKVDDQIEARKASAAQIADNHTALADRTLAVQEEISTRERDGVSPGTPAFERRKDQIQQIVAETHVDVPHAQRLRDIASTLHRRSPGGIEEAQHELLALASEMDAA
jgi:hypothetical protein